MCNGKRSKNDEKLDVIEWEISKRLHRDHRMVKNAIEIISKLKTRSKVKWFKEFPLVCGGRRLMHVIVNQCLKFWTGFELRVKERKLMGV